jgi:flagella basal body P-ring formation protein FlgA
MLRIACIIATMAPPVSAETLVTTRNIRANAILSSADLAVVDRQIPGMLSSKDQAVGLEARVSLYAGRPIRPDDLGPPALVDRNQIVPLLYRRGNLTIATDGRALERGAVGDILRLINLGSRSTVTGVVQADGTVVVGSSPKNIVE